MVIHFQLDLPAAQQKQYSLMHLLFLQVHLLLSAAVISAKSQDKVLRERISNTYMIHDRIIKASSLCIHKYYIACVIASLRLNLTC